MSQAKEALPNITECNTEEPGLPALDRKSFANDVPPGHTRMCTDPWVFVQVLGNGQTRPCCFSGLVLGYVSEDKSFESIYNGELAQNLRKQLLTGELDEFCSICNMKSVVPTANLIKEVKAIKNNKTPQPVYASPAAVQSQEAFPKAYVTLQGVDDVSIVNTATNTVLADSIKVGTTPVGLALTPDGSQLYVANFASDSISVVDTVANKVIATITVGKGPRSVLFNTNGTLAYVANHQAGTVSIIDMSRKSAIASISVGKGPWGMAISANGANLFVTNFLDSTVSIINTAKRTVFDTIKVGNSPTAIVITPDGRYLFVVSNQSNSVSVIDLSRCVISETIPVGQSPWGIAISSQQNRAYVSNEASNSVTVIDIATQKPIKEINVGRRPRGLQLTADERKLLVANSADQTCSVIDADTLYVVATLPKLVNCQEIATVGFTPLAKNSVVPPKVKIRNKVKRIAKAVVRRLAA